MHGKIFKSRFEIIGVICAIIVGIAVYGIGPLINLGWKQEVWNNIWNVIGNTLGATIGGYIAFKIAKWQYDSDKLKSQLKELTDVEKFVKKLNQPIDIIGDRMDRCIYNLQNDRIEESKKAINLDDEQTMIQNIDDSYAQIKYAIESNPTLAIDIDFIRETNELCRSCGAIKEDYSDFIYYYNEFLESNENETERQGWMECLYEDMNGYVLHREMFGKDAANLIENIRKSQEHINK